MISDVLTGSDISAIQEDIELCTQRSNCYIRLRSGTVEDLFGNANNLIEEASPGFIVTNFTSDQIPPKLNSFDFDLNTGTLVLSFSEPMRTSDIIFTGFVIQGVNSTTSPMAMYRLTGGSSPTAEGSDVVNVTLVPADLNQLKQRSYATSPADTFLSISSGTVKDTAQNPVTAILSTDALQATIVTDDITPPVLQQFDIDIDQNMVELLFNEPVMLDTVNFTLFTLLSASSTPNINITLQAGRVIKGVQDASVMVQMELSDDDAATVKLTSNFVSEINNTFILVSADAVFDTSGNGIEDTGPLKAVGFSPDVSRPVLSNYSLNIEPGLLKLTFSDVVNATTFDASAITIQSSKTAITNQVVSLTPVTITNSSNGYVITVTLGLQDLLNIRDNTMLATRLNNTYLTIQAYAIDDVFDVDVLAVTDGKAILPGEYIPDTNPPDLERFTLDLDEGTLIFKLSDLLLESSCHLQMLLTEPQKR